MPANTIYIIDDNEAVCSALKFLLDSFFSVPIEIYDNPLNFLENYSTEWRGCLIIDLFLPFMDGNELLQELKERDNCMPAIVMSGHGDRIARQQALQNGATYFLTKPFNINELLEKITEFLEPSPVAG
ncbi:two component response regulator [Legionella birminghamensis]|uniref:Two component response regulator n=2 Tax=Legionella birminghamensis TaxID=28083 RepID=A0A378IEN1_9GAMM|nr:two component response regulator [Legionella birminghamensis]STX33195.1 two-component system, OmpR family, copper resistance phosphate regulon response regulator CusR [Legionella birminghamensis]